MTMRFVLILAVVFLSSPVFASEKTPIQKLDDRAVALLDKKNENQIKQFDAIRAAHGIIKAVENVQSSLVRAVKSCGTQNPDMKEALETRLSDWRLSVRPSIQQGKSRLEKMILLQDIAKPSEVRAYLKAFDEAIAYRDKNIASVPVSDKKSCEKMLKEMDKSEKDLPKLLIENLGLDKDLNVKPTS
jgi:hypothetical protein